MNDTIFAVSSGAAPSAIAVIRISGPSAFDAVRAMAGRLPPPRRAALRRLRDPENGETLDRGLVLLFPGPGSVTGEDIVELHVHGGRAVVRAIERVLAGQPGCRPAEAGEFTRRAMEAGRIDLTEAEGLADLLAAETEMQRRAALRQAEGGLRQRVEVWTERTVRLSAMIEMIIDHSDEADATDPDAMLAEIRDEARVLAAEIGAVLAQPPVERVRDGIRVVFAGPPNSGKSSLFNVMSGRDAAIVSPISGTTRDRIEAPVVRGGVAWLLIDTAGLVDTTDDPIEAIGVARSRESIGDADVVLWMGDDVPAPAAGCMLLIHARADEVGRDVVPAGRIAANSKDVDGAAILWSALEKLAVELLPPEGSLSLNHRQLNLCCAAQSHLCAAAETGDELVLGEEIRGATQSLDRLSGKAGTEDVFDTLFSGFCIGK